MLMPRERSKYLRRAWQSLGKQCVETLINHGAFIHTKDGDNDTALTNAACAADEECVRYLLEQGLDVQHIGDWGGALYRAIESEALDCVNTLLEYCVDVNQKGGALHTPLQMAAYQGDVEPVERFCNHSADINAVGGKYHTALNSEYPTNNSHLEQSEYRLRHNIRQHPRKRKLPEIPLR